MNKSNFSRTLAAFLYICAIVQIGFCAGNNGLAHGQTESEEKSKNDSDINGYYECFLESPGGKLEFGILVKTVQQDPNSKTSLDVESNRKASATKAFIVNGTEQIELNDFAFAAKRLNIKIDHYDSEITATRKTESDPYLGIWRKLVGPKKYCELKFSAKLSAKPNFQAAPKKDNPVSGRWKVKFESSDDTAVGVFEVLENGRATGTFLTTTGDYRYLAGSFEDGALRLSCFDGAHAFLFKANLSSEKSLKGEFWSRDSWHESWTANKDPKAQLPDAFKLTRWTGNASLVDMKFPDLKGVQRSLGDKELLGHATIIHIFGSWCPNCHDAGEFVSKLEKEYADDGLKVIGVAFELTGDFDRDVAQVRTYLKRHDANYPILMAGISDKKKATETLTIIDKVRSYPTTIFVNSVGEVDSIHTGFSGPATGQDHEKLKAKFHSTVRRLLKKD